jgi:hypothetical protein
MPAAIDWFQASDYCRWLGDVTGLPIELPTEAEWEYAARNRGQDFPYATVSRKIELGRNYPSKDDNKRQPVNSFMPNPLDLHHMGSNLQEWVSDWYDEKYYKHSPEKNPQGPVHGTEKVQRGGVADNNPEFNHNFVRAHEEIDYTHDKDRLEMFNFNEGEARFQEGARCAIHLSKPIDIDNLTIDLSKPALTAGKNGWRPRMALPLLQTELTARRNKPHRLFAGRARHTQAASLNFVGPTVSYNCEATLACERRTGRSQFK